MRIYFIWRMDTKYILNKVVRRWLGCLHIKVIWLDTLHIYWLSIFITGLVVWQDKLVAKRTRSLMLKSFRSVGLWKNLHPNWFWFSFLFLCQKKDSEHDLNSLTLFPFKNMQAHLIFHFAYVIHPVSQELVSPSLSSPPTFLGTTTRSSRGVCTTFSPPWGRTFRGRHVIMSGT